MCKAFYVSHKNDAEQTGIAIKSDLQPVPNKEGGIDYRCVVHVLWDDVLSPAPSFHSPEDLVHAGIVFESDAEDDELTEEDEEAEEGNEDYGNASETAQV